MPTQHPPPQEHPIAFDELHTILGALIIALSPRDPTRSKIAEVLRALEKPSRRRIGKKGVHACAEIPRYRLLEILRVGSDRDVVCAVGTNDSLRCTLHAHPANKGMSTVTVRLHFLPR